MERRVESHTSCQMTRSRAPGVRGFSEQVRLCPFSQSGLGKLLDGLQHPRESVLLIHVFASAAATCAYKLIPILIYCQMHGTKAASPNLLLDIVLVDAVDSPTVVVAATIVGAGVKCLLDTFGPGGSSAVVAERALVGRGGSYMTRVSGFVFVCNSCHCKCCHGSSTYKCLMGCRGNEDCCCSLVGVGRSSCMETSSHDRKVGGGTEIPTGPSSPACACAAG